MSDKSYVKSHVTKDGKLFINQNDSFENRDRAYKEWNTKRLNKELKSNPSLRKQLISNMKTLGSNVSYKKNKSGLPTSKINASKTTKNLQSVFSDYKKPIHKKMGSFASDLLKTASSNAGRLNAAGFIASVLSPSKLGDSTLRGTYKNYKATYNKKK